MYRERRSQLSGSCFRRRQSRLCGLYVASKIVGKSHISAVSSNSGHNSTSLDASWALNNDVSNIYCSVKSYIDPRTQDAIIDHAYRAYHLSTLSTKHVIKAYYGREQKTAIWSGCSTAGRQGLKAAQEFPEDFDSVIIGSPANWMTHLQVSTIPSQSKEYLNQSLNARHGASTLARSFDRIHPTDGSLRQIGLSSIRPCLNSVMKLMASRTVSSATRTNACRWSINSETNWLNRSTGRNSTSKVYLVVPNRLLAVLRRLSLMLLS